MRTRNASAFSRRSVCSRTSRPSRTWIRGNRIHIWSSANATLSVAGYGMAGEGAPRRGRHRVAHPTSPQEDPGEGGYAAATGSGSVSGCRDGGEGGESAGVRGRPAYRGVRGAGVGHERQDGRYMMVNDGTFVQRGGRRSRGTAEGEAAAGMDSFGVRACRPAHGGHHQPRAGTTGRGGALPYSQRHRGSTPYSWPRRGRHFLITSPLAATQGCAATRGGRSIADGDLRTPATHLNDNDKAIPAVYVISNEPRRLWNLWV